MNTIKFILFCILLSLLGCNQKKGLIDFDESILTPSKKIEKVNDTIFLSLVTSMNEHNGLIYLSDDKNNRIVCIDSNYDFLRIIGSPGHGPSEFSFVGGSIVNSGKLYVVDKGHQRVNIYDLTGKHAGNINGILQVSNRFLIEDTVYYGSSITKGDEFPIFKANLDGKIVKLFGTKDRMLTTLNQNAPKVYFLEKWQDQIIAACQSDPVVERYTLNGELIERLELTSLSHFQPYILYQEEREKKEKRGVASFFDGSYLKDNLLYLLLLGFDKAKNKTISQHILILNIKQKKLIPTRIIKLENNNGNEAWYYSFCVMGNKLIAYDAYSYEIHEFTLKD